MAEKEKITCPLCGKNFLGKKRPHQLADVMKNMNTSLKLMAKGLDIQNMIIARYTKFLDESMAHIELANGPQSIANAIGGLDVADGLDLKESNY